MFGGARAAGGGGFCCVRALDWRHGVSMRRLFYVSRTWNDMGDHGITGPYRANQAFQTYPTASRAVDILVSRGLQRCNSPYG